MATHKSRESLYSAASLRWFLYYMHVHGKTPCDTTTEADKAALRAICDEQAGGNYHPALRTIEAIIDAPIPGDSLAARFPHFLAWVDARCPRRYRAPTAYALRQYREIARGAA